MSSAISLWLTVITVLSFKITTVICGISLEIFQNSDDSSTQLSTKVETRSARNVSLTCKIFDSRSDRFFNSEVVWAKKGIELGFNKILGSTNLSFTPITLRNRGTYFCASLKYGLYKIIYIAVKRSDNSDKSPKKKRWKRADVIPGTSPTSSLTYSFKTASENFPTPLPTYRHHNFDWNREAYTIPSEINHLYNEKQNHQFEYSSTAKKTRTFSYAGVIAAVVALILIVGVSLYRLVKRFDLLYAISPERISEAEPECRHPTCGQYCTFATNNTGENGVQNHDNVHTLSVNSTNNTSVPTLRILPSTTPLPNSSAERTAQTSTVDLPPSYDNSLQNCDKYNLPPSYNEALRYMSGNSLQNLQRGTTGVNTQNLPRST